MIEIPEEGLRIWMCRHAGCKLTIEDLVAPKSKCSYYMKLCCKIDMKPCDAQAYRIVREKP